ncbi:MAG TPA: SDR family oxidoreductase [Paraburkholderia sp.]|jgi:gluconate 5-dehydrogenase|nr:SDR family oxidoreductase [Paraburkholderia sp.]
MNATAVAGSPHFRLDGRVALVTGSSQGIGFALATALGHAGARVVINAQKADRVAVATASLREQGIGAYGVPFDVLDEAGVARAIAQIEHDIGAIDILVNNVGIQLRKPLEEFTSGEWHRVIDTNLTSAFIVSKAVVPGMIGRRRGKIVNTCSLMSDLGRYSTAPYAASKGGLKMLTRGMCVDWARHNIQVNGIAPGYIRTELTRALVEDAKFSEWVASRTPAGRWGDVQELGGTAVFLASPASDFINGQVIYVDGGITASL